MIKIICDKCGTDCDLCGFDITARVIHNPSPASINDRGELKATDDNSFVRFVLCQKCYKKFGLPNVYEACASGKLIFNESEAMQRNE